MFSRLVSRLIEVMLGHCGEIWKESVCFVRWNHLCRCLHKAFCELTISIFNPKVRHLRERICGKRFMEFPPLTPELQKQSFKESRKGWGCTIWFASWSPVGAQALTKRKRQSLHGGAEDAQEEAMLRDKQLQCCINHIQFRYSELIVLPNRHLK